ncbi:PPC domain-containing DNA-binding protein [Bacteroidota bacterium]
MRKNNLWKLIVFFIIILPKPAGYAQLPQEEIQDHVPDAVSTSGQFEKVIVVRMKQGADLLEGLKSAAEKETIKNAVILSGIGSLVSYHIHVVDNNTFPSENVFIKNDTPVDLTSVNGYIFDGRVHAHVNVSDERLALGGHLEPGNEVFTFAIITIGIFNDEVNLDRFDDKYWR